MDRILKSLVILGLLMSSVSIRGQAKATLSGVITESSSNETLIGVTVAFPSLGTGVTTNEYGFYSISLPAGSYEIIVSYLGFAEIRTTIVLEHDTKRDFSMDEQSEQLQEVIVTEDVEKLDIRKPQMSVNTYR